MSEHETLLRRKQVEAMTGLGRSSLYAAIQRGEFPKPVKISAKAVAWRQSEVAAWIQAREAA